MPARATRIQLCGGLAVEWEGERIEDELRGRQGRLLFSFLVLHRQRPVRRDAVVGAVWPEEAPHGVEANLAPLLSRLRRVVGADGLVGRADLRLVLPAGATVDWEELHDDVRRARAALGSGDHVGAREAASRALEVAAGGLLPGLEAPWLEERRRELAALREEARELLARAALAIGGPDLGIAEGAARAAVQAAPFRESARALLIEALRAQGNLAEALLVYEDLRILLRDELGTAPGAELIALHAAVLADLEAPAPPPPAGAGPAPAGVPTPPAAAPALPDLVERDRELAELTALVGDAAAGQGRVALIEGPAGVGKTRLLAEMRRRGGAAGLRVLWARAGQLEREFPFGVVRQLFEGELADLARRDELLAGAAAPARAVVDASAGTGGDTSFAVLHGLFWLVANLAEEAPLLLAVDDLHWCDRPSLRSLAYLVRRLEGLPVLLAATLRTGEAATEPALLDELLHDPATESVRPGALSAGAVRVVVRARLGEEATERFCATCHATTGGNPLLLRQLLTALLADGVRPDDEHAAVVREIGPRAVSRTIELRLDRMSPGAVAVARAIAVLGEGAELPVVAALAALPEDAVAGEVASLARAEVLRPEPPLGFVHPLVRDAVYATLPIGERELQHLRAARALAAAGTPDEAVAVHLRLVPRRGDPWVSAVLHRAGASAARRGASDSAVELLRRALDEPPPPERRAELLLELGRTEQLVDGVAAVAHLEAAVEALEDPEVRARAATELAWTQFFVRPAHDAIATARRARAAAPAELEDLRQGLEAIELITMFNEGTRVDELRERFERLGAGAAAGDGLGAKRLLAISAWARTLTGDGRAGSVADARRALAGGVLATDGLFIVCPSMSLALADADDALSAWDVVVAEAHRRGSLFLSLTVHIWRGMTLLLRGELREAETSLRAGIEELALWGSGQTVFGYPIAMLARTLLHRGDPVEARATLAAIGPQPPGSEPDRMLRTSRAELLLAEGRTADALAEAERVAEISRRHVHPEWAPWRSLLARCLAEAGRLDEALPLAEEELALARAWGAPSTTGRCLRILGELEGAAGLDRLREAVRVLEPSAARLGRAQALASLGTALRAAGAPGEAVPALAQAADLAEICEAAPLAARCREALRALGASPRGAPTGAAALTDVERRVADLAAAGREGRLIAQMLYLTPREAEEHLDRVRRKLGTDRAEEMERALTAA